VGVTEKVRKFVKLIRDHETGHYVALESSLNGMWKEQFLRFNRVYNFDVLIYWAFKRC
jgi:hypothetical protein